MDKTLDETLKEYSDNQRILGETLNKLLDTAISTTEQIRKIKTIGVELKEFNDKILALSGENPNNYPYRAKGPDPYYVPPTDSKGDADYLKDVPSKLKKYVDKNI